MKTIHISDNQKLKEIKEAFSNVYPHLKLEFFSEDHKTGEASARKAMYDDSLCLKDIRKNHHAGDLSVDGHQKTSTFERSFHDHFGLSVQVFRRSGNIWLQTTTTDDWTLAHQEETGKEFDK
ncbi:MAG: hypothetical protein IPM74_06790 [Crocinitomicaceae bacterium]|nr:hypothetical protein [Crocinitomicaceae bacterium]MBK8925605.1 hypothetical protein [Crocinitomicaceae bacterium]